MGIKDIPTSWGQINQQDMDFLQEPTLWAMACRGGMREIAHGVGSWYGLTCQ